MQSLRHKYRVGTKHLKYVIAAKTVSWDCPVMKMPPKPRSTGRYEAKPRRIAMLCFDDAQGIDVTGPLSVFSTATDMLGPSEPRAYTQLVLAPTTSSIAISCGLNVVPDAHFLTADLEEIDTLVSRLRTALDQTAQHYGINEH